MTQLKLPPNEKYKIIQDQWREGKNVLKWVETKDSVDSIFKFSFFSEKKEKQYCIAIWKWPEGWDGTTGGYNVYLNESLEPKEWIYIVGNRMFVEFEEAESKAQKWYLRYLSGLEDIQLSILQ